MIAIIGFEEEQVMLKAEAERLGLKYVVNDRYGYRVDRTGTDKKLQKMDSYDFYEDQTFRKRVEDPEHEGMFKLEGYYKDEECTKEVNSYYRYYRAPEGEWVTVAEKGHLVNLEDFISKCKMKFYIEQALPTEAGDPTSLMVVMDKVTTKFNDMIAAVQNLEKSQTFNERCNVHVGGGLITTYNELLLEEDVCTDVLQNDLNKGWRIIAACVQPDSRRPDYILGRYNPEFDSDTSAKRRG